MATPEAQAQIDIDRNNLVFLMLIVVTLMVLCTFLFAFFILDNFATVPCDINRATGPQGRQGKQGVKGADNTQVGPKGLTPIGPGLVKGPRGPAGEELPGDTGDVSSAGTGFIGPPGDTGDQGPSGFDGLIEPYLQFAGANQSRLEFFAQTELLVKVTSPTFGAKETTTTVVLTRQGAQVTVDIYPFLLYKQQDTTGKQGTINIALFTSTLPLSEYAPTTAMILPAIVSKFTVTESEAPTDIAKATQTNVDWGGILEVIPNSGCTLYGYFSVYDPDNVGGPPDISRLLFKAEDSPFGIEGVISVSWLIDPPT